MSPLFKRKPSTPTSHGTNTHAVAGLVRGVMGILLLGAICYDGQAREYRPYGEAEQKAMAAATVRAGKQPYQVLLLPGCSGGVSLDSGHAVATLSEVVRSFPGSLRTCFVAPGGALLQLLMLNEDKVAPLRAEPEGEAWSALEVSDPNVAATRYARTKALERAAFDKGLGKVLRTGRPSQRKLYRRAIRSLYTPGPAPARYLKGHVAAVKGFLQTLPYHIIASSEGVGYIGVARNGVEMLTGGGPPSAVMREILEMGRRTYTDPDIKIHYKGRYVCKTYPADTSMCQVEPAPDQLTSPYTGVPPLRIRQGDTLLIRLP
jgi:hypothetical protein